MIKTLHIRVKDKHSNILNRMAMEVNMVWNFTNELSHRSINERYKWLSGYELQKYVTGSSQAGLCIPQETINSICNEYAYKRNQAKKTKLSWRTSFGSRKSLGWIPIKKGSAKYRNGKIFFYGSNFGIWDSYGLSKYELRSGNFSQDGRGRWYINIAVEVADVMSDGTKAIGIDLGLKEFLTTSDGLKVKAEQIYRKSENDLATAQRANKKNRVRAIHAKIKNRRADMLHKLSTKLVGDNAAIFVGNVSSSKLARTNMGKSVNDAGWYMFKKMLEYKSIRAQVFFEEVNEAWSTQTCSACGCIAGPKGLAGLNEREWTCVCGVTHDRDINSAAIILARGLSRLEAGSQCIGSSQYRG